MRLVRGGWFGFFAALSAGAARRERKMGGKADGGGPARAASTRPLD